MYYLTAELIATAPRHWNSLTVAKIIERAAVLKLVSILNF